MPVGNNPHYEPADGKCYAALASADFGNATDIFARLQLFMIQVHDTLAKSGSAERVQSKNWLLAANAL